MVLSGKNNYCINKETVQNQALKKRTGNLASLWAGAVDSMGGGGHFSHPLGPQTPASTPPRPTSPRPACPRLGVCGRGRLDPALAGWRDPLGLFAGIRDHFQQERGKTSISYCT